MEGGIGAILTVCPSSSTPSQALQAYLGLMCFSTHNFAGSICNFSDVSVFEPTHGSAPKYAEYETSIVSPIAMILSACMMLDHIGETEKASKIRNAISKTVEQGKVRTYDMLKLSGSQDVLNQGAASTTQMTDEIIKHLK